MERMMSLETTHEVSNGNVFADLGLPSSEQELVKAKLTVQIYQILRNRKLAQTEAARLLGTTQAQVSALMRCRPVPVSVGRLMELSATLGHGVEVTAKPAGVAGRDACRSPLRLANCSFKRLGMPGSGILRRR
jgi:predicted XRE-type DNA-binding protein